MRTRDLAASPVLVKQELAVNVESSSGMGDTIDIYRTDDATKVWRRLVKKVLADHDVARDVYFLL